MKIKERIDSINSVIKQLERERAHIRENLCDHQKVVKAVWSDYPGHAYPAIVCAICGENLGVYDEDEAKNYNF